MIRVRSSHHRTGSPWQGYRQLPAEGSAYSHLRGGDFMSTTRVASGTYSEPRVAIHMEGDHVAEVRGVNHRQELEPALLDLATENITLWRRKV